MDETKIPINKYNPSPEEMRMAENTMTPEQEEMSKKRVIEGATKDLENKIDTESRKVEELKRLNDETQLLEELTEGKASKEVTDLLSELEFKKEDFKYIRELRSAIREELFSIIRDVSKNNDLYFETKRDRKYESWYAGRIVDTAIKHFKKIKELETKTDAERDAINEEYKKEIDNINEHRI